MLNNNIPFVYLKYNIECYILSQRLGCPLSWHQARHLPPYIPPAHARSRLPTDPSRITYAPPYAQNPGYATWIKRPALPSKALHHIEMKTLQEISVFSVHFRAQSHVIVSAHACRENQWNPFVVFLVDFIGLFLWHSGLSYREYCQVNVIGHFLISELK